MDEQQLANQLQDPTVNIAEEVAPQTEPTPETVPSIETPTEQLVPEGTSVEEATAMQDPDEVFRTKYQALVEETGRMWAVKPNFVFDKETKQYDTSKITLELTIAPKE